jgi:PadR family transcriptional regulator, regulatory protein AphA
MARENTSRYAVLGMLTAGPRTGYDIRREIHGSVRHFWSESYGQVYPVLHQLVEEGLATMTVEPGAGRPDRKVYSLTSAGWKELRRWLLQPVAPQPSRNELLLKLFFGRHVPAAELARVVEAFRDRWVADVAAWGEIEDHLRSGDPSGMDDLDRRDRLFTLRYGRLIGEATVRWADEVLAALSGADGKAPPNTSSPQGRTGSHDR